MSAVWLAGRRLVAIDGSWLVAADAVKNPVFLGARGQQQRKAGVPAGVYSPTISSDIRAGEYGHVLSGKLEV